MQDPAGAGYAGSAGRLTEGGAASRRHAAEQPGRAEAGRGQSASPPAHDTVDSDGLPHPP